MNQKINKILLASERSERDTIRDVQIRAGAVCVYICIRYTIAKKSGLGAHITHELSVIPRQSCRAPSLHTRYSLCNLYYPGMCSFGHVATCGNIKCGLCPYLIHTF